MAELRVDRPEAVSEFDWAEDGWLEESQAIVKQTERLPALTAAGIALDVWCRIAPLQRAPCVGSLLVSALPMARGKTRHHLLGLNAGLRPHTYRRAHLHDLSQPLAGFLEGVRTAAELGHKDLHCLSLAQERFSLKLKGRS